jgi:hypothetical protein
MVHADCSGVGLAASDTEEMDYYQVPTWPSYREIGAGFDNFFNKGGWKLQAEVNEKAECASPNLYHFRLVHAAD